MLTVLYLCDYHHMAGSSLSMLSLIQSLKNNINPIVVVGDNGEVADYCQQHSIRYIIVPFYYNYYRYKGDWLHGIRRKLSYALRSYQTNRKFVDTVVSKLKDTKVDIVHSNTSAISFGMEIAQKLNAKHLWQIREFLDTFTDIHIWGGKTKLVHDLKKADGIICSSRPLSKHFSLEDHPNIHCIWDAVRSKNDFCYNEKKEKYFLYCARGINRFKGADFLVDAFCSTGLAKRGYTLMLIGECNENFKTELLEIAGKYDCRNSLFFRGLVDEPTLKDIMSKAAALTQCSKIEGLGRVVIEAMFYGCPVIARNNGGTADFMTHQQTGFLFNTKKELVELMKTIALEQPRKVILQAQQFAIDSFAIEDYGNRIMNVYKSLVK